MKQVWDAEIDKPVEEAGGPVECKHDRVDFYSLANVLGC